MTTGPATRETAAALEYLRTGESEPWRWTEDGAVLTWKADGGTVVFRDELLAILEWLAPTGLPAFPALAILLAACRGRTMTLDDLLGPAEPVRKHRSAAAAEWAAKQSAARRPFRLRCQGVLDALEGLEGWPRNVLAGTQAKAELAAAVFERSGAWVDSPGQAREVIAGLRSGLLTDAALNQARRRPRELAAKLLALTGLEGVDPAALDRRVRTGTETPLLPATLPPETFLPPAALARQLMARLGRDPAYAGLARAARDLLAALSLPRRLPDRDGSATGGVADVANRGSLDKLLLSELAHDDLTLAVRVALNEALYLRHEPPATAKAVSMALLLDAGVRMWGVPRLFAASAALALGAADERRPGLRAWRANGSRLEPVDLLSADGFQLHLGALATEAHPGAALPAFFSALEPANAAPSARAETEAVVLTHRDTLADAGFRRALDRLRVPPGVALLVATVDRDGRFELRTHPPGGKPPLCEATIRLDDLQRAPEKPARPVALPPSPAPLLDPRTPSDLPVILSLPRLPFLLPVHEELSGAHAAPDGRTYAVSRSRRLLSWRETRHGAAVLAAGLPSGRTLMLLSERESGRVHVLKDARREGRIPLATYDPASGDVRTVRLEAPRSPPLAVHMNGAVVLLFYRTRAEVFRLEDGEKLASVAAPVGARWRNGRYYRIFEGRNTRWCYGSWDGLAGGFEPIHGDVGAARVIFDRVGRPGPWMLTDKGEVCHVESRGVIFSLGKPVPAGQSVHVSRDGHHLFLETGQPGKIECIDLKNSRVRERVLDPQSVVRGTDEPHPERPQYPLMNRFSAVGVLPSGNLALRNRWGWWWEFLQYEHGAVGFRRLPTRDEMTMRDRARPFGRAMRPSPADYWLKEARWNDGGRAFLDSRGLLHLKFLGSTAEFSLVLTSGSGAIWANDGRMAGADFFRGPDQTEADLDGLLRTLRALCERLR